MNTYQEMLISGQMQLMDAGIEEIEAKSCAWILFSYCFQMSRVDFMMECLSFREMTDDDQKHYEAYLALIAKRAKGIPVQYQPHEQNFYGYDFYVAEGCLIPRQDTEVLVETVVQTVTARMALKKEPTAGTLYDLCTGSGCIAITLSLMVKWEEVVASDVSKRALAVAQKNNERYENPVTLCEGDLFEAVAMREHYFDVIVSNPPYIRSDVIETLDTCVRDQEPRLALDGHEDGLFFYQRIIRDARQYLKKEGLLFVEIGYDQAREVQQLYEENGYKDVRIVADLAGHDRVVWARYDG